MTDHEAEVQRLMGLADALARAAFNAGRGPISDAEHAAARVALESALREALQSQWQDIATAPKDERVWLSGRGVTFVGRWGDYQRHNQPCITHWMKLPEPPAPQQKDIHA